MTRHEHRFDKYRRYLMTADPLGDAACEALARLPLGKGRQVLLAATTRGIDQVPEAPEALQALFRALDEVPFWVDWDQLDLGGRTFLRSGPFGALILGGLALPLAYSSPAGNKPLMFSGKLVQRAPRRLVETARFVYESCRPGGLRRQAPGFQLSVMTRMIHCQIRRLLWQSGRWNESEWGAPLNQADMAGTNIFFSALILISLARLGFRFSVAEVEATMALWRYSGHLMGVEPELLCPTLTEGRRLADLILEAQGKPDDDSRALIAALLDVPLHYAASEESLRLARHLRGMYCGLMRRLLYRGMARDLAVPRSGWEPLLSLLRLVIGPLETIRPLVPGATGLVARAGSEAWRWVAETELDQARVLLERWSRWIYGWKRRRAC